MQVKKTKDMSMDNIKLKASVYGVAGSGKTTFGATFPNPIFLDMNKGLLSVRDKDVAYVELYTSTFVEIKDALDSAINSEYDSIIIDSMGEISEACMRHILQLNRRTKPEYSDWDSFFHGMKDFILKIRNCDKHVLCICHEGCEKDEGTGRLWYRPAFQGQLRTKYDAYFDELYHAEVEQVPGKATVYKLLARPSGIFTAKSRLLRPTVKESYLEPEFSKIMELAK